MRQRGVSLVEILVSMTLGLFLLLGLTTFMANTLVSDSRTMLMSRLDQEMRSAMILMVREVRRSGYWGNPSLALGPWTGAGAGTAYANPFAAVTASGGCIQFRYDKNHNAIADATEFFGFLRTGTGVIQMYGGSGLGNCAGGAGWTDLTDGRNSNVTALGFSLLPAAPAYASGTSGPNMRVRYVTIQLTAQSRSDPTISQTWRETVKLENDLFCPTATLC